MGSQYALQSVPTEVHQLNLFEPGSAEAHRAPATAFTNILDLQSAWRQQHADLRAHAHGHHEVLMRLAAAVAHREGDSAVHIARIGRLSECLALALGMDAEFAKLLRLASPMHDIGKINLPDSIIGKQDALTREEWDLIRRHPQLGAQLLSDTEVPLLRLAAEVALSHHEKFDGDGYPQGLAGPDIPLSGRIVALIDFFEALTTDRPYRKALPDARVLDMIIAESGKHFDPDVIRTFLGVRDALITERDKINAVETQLDALVRL